MIHKNMRQNLFLLIISLVIFLSAACNQKQSDRQENAAPDSVSAIQAPDTTVLPIEDTATAVEPAAAGNAVASLSNFSRIQYFHPAKPVRDVSIRDFVQRLGRYDSTFVHTDSLCPIGQLHFWNLPAQNCRIFALGDDYTARHNPAAPCRLYGIQRTGDDSGVDYEGFLGVQLGENAKAVEEKLEAFVKANPGFRYEKVRYRSPVEQFLTGRSQSVYSVTDGKRFYLFGLGKRRKLDYILIANFDVQAAC